MVAFNQYYLLAQRNDAYRMTQQTKRLVCFIIFRDDQARYGEFEELVELCRQLGLSYDRISDARYEHNGESARWRPDMERPLVEDADQSGKPMVHCECIEECLATLRAGRIAEGIKALQDLVPDVAPLPRFEVDAGK